MLTQQILNRPFSFQNQIMGYMKVEDVLRYLEVKIIGCTQYQLVLDGNPLPSNFFKCEDISKRYGKEKYRIMECHVTQYLFNPEQPKQ